MKNFSAKHTLIVLLALVLALSLMACQTQSGNEQLAATKSPETTDGVTTPGETTVTPESTPPATDPVVDPTDGPDVTVPDETDPPVTTGTPSQSGEGQGGAVPPETTPNVTEPPVTTPEPTEPPATTPKPTQPNHTHSYTFTKTVAATCTAKGYDLHSCSCGSTQKKNETAALGHDYVKSGTTDATCTANGMITYKCSICSGTKNETLNKLGHEYVNGGCKRCGAKDPDAEPEPEPDDDDPFGGVTPSNMNLSNTADWDSAKFSFFKSYYWWNGSMTTEQKHNFYYCMYDGYECGTEGHCCMSAAEHKPFLTPCDYCGKVDCQDRIYWDSLGFTVCDDSLCSAYSEEKDPFYYCQSCGKRKAYAGCDWTEVCVVHLTGGTCDKCGEAVKAYECHTCKK